ncbi:hypothetical protein ACSBR2_015422 [Camellia fascicularis]
MIVLPKQQKEEIAQGLLETHRPFLWVMRPKKTHDEEKEEEEEDEDALSCMEELEQQGIIVPWCSQQESEEVKRCIEEVIEGEERGEEIRRNAKKLNELTREAVKEGGSSDLNLKAFVEEIGVEGGDCSSSV